MNDAEHHRHVTVRDYLHVVWRRRWLILPLVVLVPLLAAGLSLRKTPVYEASAQVLLNRTNLGASLAGVEDPTVYGDAERNAVTQAGLASVPAVLRKTVEAAKVPGLTAEDLSAQSSVKEEVDADLLTFVVQNDDPDTAARLATEYARQFTVYRYELDTAALRRARGEVETRMRELEGEGRKDTDVYNGFAEKASQLSTLEALQTSRASLVREAVDSEQVSPKPVRDVVLGLALGLVLGVGLALLRDALDTRMRSGEEIAERLGVTLLARLPEPPRRLRSANQLVMLADPNSADGESFRILRTNVDFANVRHRAQTMLVTSAVQGEGKSTTVANLAISMARAGRRVALVDLDLRRPRLAELFDLGDAMGLTLVLLGEALLDDVVHTVPLGSVDGARNGAGTDLGTLDVIPTGPTPLDPGELVGSTTLAEVLEVLAARYDVVLIDTPPMLSVGDALALTTHVDAVLLVARANLVRRPMLDELRRSLGTAPAPTLGVILTGAERAAAYGNGGSYYGYTARPRETVR